MSAAERSLSDPTYAVLADRLAQCERESRARWLLALILHVTVLAFALALQVRAPSREAAKQILTVQILPAQRLGSERPAPPRPDPTPPPAKPAEPPPPAPQPKPAAVPPPEPRKPAPASEAPNAAAEKPAATPPAAPATPADALPPGSERGLPGGLSATGTTLSAIDDPDFTFGYYLDQLLESIRRQWTRPPVGAGVEAVLHFTVERDGRVSALEVKQSSGISSFDIAARGSVMAASPLPPLPKGYAGESLGVTLVAR
jgi:TonB family protein